MSLIKSMTKGRSLAMVLVVVGVSSILMGAKSLLISPSAQTNDAYIRADVTNLSVKISGLVSDVLVDDNQVVKKGELLAKIDARDLQLAVEQALAQLEASNAQIIDIQAKLARQQDLIAVAKAKRDAVKAELDFARQERLRYQQMATAGAGSKQKADQTASRERILQAQVQQENATLEATANEVKVLNAQLLQAQAKFTTAKAQVTQASLNLSYTEVRAPMDGVIGKRHLRVGQWVSPGQSLIAIVPTENYIIANFLETQLAQVAVGSDVNIEIDAIPNKVFSGKVESIAPASGVTFNQLAPENATGNFTKIVQRIPVKVRIASHENTLQVRVGMSANVQVVGER
ncbi:HlyD family secretion protein [Pseudomonas sp. F1_0610]|uniref:HlyD family secretion protein n=1 Tax=Pseudomonas sp. F1_0610 TaxID=3114284 RepID=UPI0039C3DE7D